MTSAVVVFNNTTQFNSTDHVTSSWVHTLPLVVNWAIRWRHFIYTEETLRYLKFEFTDFSKIEFKIDQLFWKLIYYPVLYWLLWALMYFVLMGFVFKRFTRNTKYFSGVNDFKEFMKPKDKKVIEKDESYIVTLLKYLLKHFSLLIIMFPVSLFCFYNYYFNTVYIILLMVFLGWNTARNNFQYMKKLKAQVELIEEEF